MDKSIFDKWDHADSKEGKRIAGPSRLVKGVVGLFGIWLVASSFYTIDQGERGVLLRFGKVIGVEDSGLHFKIPFVDAVKKMTVRTVKWTLPTAVYSKDIQGAEVKISLNFHLNPSSVGSIYANAGLSYDEKLILPQLLSVSKDVFGKYNAVSIVQAREELSKEICKALEARFAPIGIIIESVQLENIDFSDSYEKSVEERMKAEVEVQKVKQNLEREKINAEMLRTKAQGEADAKVAQATANAKSIELVGKAEAEAIRAKSEAMKANPDYVRMLQAEKWDGKLPQSIVPSSSVPILKLQ